MSTFKKNHLLNIFLIVYFVLLSVYSIFSYSLTSPNLVLSSWPPYWNFQLLMWESFFNNRPILSYSYLILLGLLFIVYFLIIKAIKKNKIKKINLGCYLILILPLILSNNALSYDVFNYIFNAKMVLIYHANPHLQTAMDFIQDNWTRFMHNIHTPAPYGYGWTILSLLPFLLGFGKFLPTWIMFRLFSVLSVVLLYLTIKLLAKKINHPLSSYSMAIVFLNPLFLIELVSNSHNDLWMMVPALLSLILVIPDKKNNIPAWMKKWLSILLLSFSISTKFASIVLIPVWFYLLFQNQNWLKQFIKKFKLSKLSEAWPTVASILLFLPLLSERSKQFLPWYLVWSLIWIPFIKNRFYIKLLLIFSFSAMLSYAPWMWFGEYTVDVSIQQKLISWTPGLIYLLAHFSHKKLYNK
jgi:hypothetical protein